MTYREGDHEVSLWNEHDGMYYDAIEFGPGHSMQLPVRSLVGLIPLYATLVLEPSIINRFPGFKKRMEWFIDNRPEVAGRNMANMKGEQRIYISRSGLLTKQTQPAERNSEGCSPLPTRTALFVSSKRCWMKMNSSASMESDRT
jgi:hypothetical protein